MDEKNPRDKSVNFPIVFHFHQPVDNFDWVFEDVYEKCYQPLLQQIEDHPAIRFTVHFTGSLLEWYLDHKSDMIDTIARLAKRGQIEILGGGYYEPIFAIIPREDRIHQMLMLRDFIKETFGLEVRGAWLSERVWEPHYPSFLLDAGLSYIIVDDNHFRSCGLVQEDTFYTYTTEDEGKVIRVFPINEPLRYLSPWKAAWQSMDYLRTTVSTEGDRVVLFMSDAEKLGVWGTTHELCYVKGHGDDQDVPFVKALFDHIEWNMKNKRWLKTVTLSEYEQNFSSRGLLYFPNATYDRMEEWALPSSVRRRREKLRLSLEAKVNPPAGTKPDPLAGAKAKERLEFLRGGFWRYFLVKYPEVNNMHKKMLYVREKIKAVETSTGSSPLTKKAWNEVYMAQANDCYWHGQFGGVYYAVFRDSVYRHLITAETLIETKIRVTGSDQSGATPRVNHLDFFKDSYREMVAETEKFNFYANPTDGGVFFELDYRPACYNLLNLMSRWEEAYHDPGKVVIDRFRKAIGRVQVVAGDLLLLPYAQERNKDYGDFAGTRYQIETQVAGHQLTVIMSRDGFVHIGTDSSIPIRLTKVLQHENGSKSFVLQVTATIQAGHIDPEVFGDLDLAIDLPFFLSGDPQTITMQAGEKSIRRNQKFKGSATNLAFHDAEKGIQFQIDCATLPGIKPLFVYPVRTFSRMNDTYEKTHQGTNIVVRMPLGALVRASTAGNPAEITWMFQ